MALPDEKPSPDDFMNHSCDPNVWMADEVTLISRKDIGPLEELTAEHAVWSTDFRWVAPWSCDCGTPLCRKTITGDDWKLVELQCRYSGHFSPYINECIRKLRGETLVELDTPDILKEIVEVKRCEVERLKVEAPISQLEKRIEMQRPALNFAGALMGDSVRVIAEVKKASPAKGLLRKDFDPVSLATMYMENGAAAISVLTNADHFQGSTGHMEAVSHVAGPKGIPVLRKEFIFDPYQVYETRAFGADAILLIVAMLSRETLGELRALAEKFWLQCLVEVHDERELGIALDAGAEVIGINNRDLRTFKTDLEVTERLAPMVPFGKIIVSESGISNRDHIQRVQQAGANAALIGEALVTAPDVGAKLRGFI